MHWARSKEMKVLNMHEWELRESPERVGALIDSLASREDALWPNRCWPCMKFDRPLSVGAEGGHGPIRYFVKAYTAGKNILFQFTGPRGFNGHHRYEIIDLGPHRCVLRHTLEMNTSGPATASWPILFRPMHDALIEDSLAQAQASLGHTPLVRPWSAWVRVLRWLLSGGRPRPQKVQSIVDVRGASASSPQ